MELYILVVSFDKSFLNVRPDVFDLLSESSRLLVHHILECKEARMGSANPEVQTALSAHYVLAESIYIHLNYLMEKSNKVRNKKNAQPLSRISYITQLTSK